MLLRLLSLLSTEHSEFVITFLMTKSFDHTKCMFLNFSDKQIRYHFGTYPIIL